MRLNEALSVVQKCQIPKLIDYSVLEVMDSEDFYYPSPMQLMHRDEQSKFIILSAPGAVGKTSMAKFIARNYGGLYWNTALKPVGGTSFAGEIAHATGIGNGSLQDNLFLNLKTGKGLIVLDSFDETALISRREGVKEFLLEIGEILSDSKSPSIILTARTEMAQFIIDVCKENGFGFTCYNIDYFEESDATRFIEQYLQFKGIGVTAVQKKIIEQYIDEIKQRIGVPNEIRSFIGYAQVLRILARQFESAFTNTSSETEIHLSAKTHENNRLIYDIIQELITREQEKLVQFKNTIREKYIPFGKEYVVDSLYCKKEQLTRLQFFAMGGEVSIDDCANCNELLPDDKVAYLELLLEWLPQHVFLQSQSIIPIFSDYLLAESLLNRDLVMFAEEYQNTSRPKLPTRVFMDCYLSLNNGCVNSEHIYLLDSAYFSQIATGNKAFCDIGTKEDFFNATEDTGHIYLTFSDNEISPRSKLSIRIIRGENDPICLNRVENMCVNVDGKVVLSPGFIKDVVIRQASIECDCLEFNAPEVLFETYGCEENRVIVHDSAIRFPGNKIIIKGTKKLKVDFPFEGNDQLKRLFHEFSPYQYTFCSNENGNCCCDDKEQFVYGLKKVLEQFRTDRYEGDPAKHKEKIDARCHTGVKARVLAFLKAEQLVYEEGVVYKCSLARMDELHISRVAYTHFNYEQLECVYIKYLEWQQASQV